MANRMLALLAAAALCGAAGCTVKPLYGDVSASIGDRAGAAASLSSVAIKPAETREEQEVRNHLVFMLGGGAGEPAAARYSLELGVVASTRSSAAIQIARDNEPTAGSVAITSRYVLTDTATGEVVAVGSRSVSSSFDRPQQQYASYRAERDAQNRAARELAEILRIVIAQELEDLPQS